MGIFGTGPKEANPEVERVQSEYQSKVDSLGEEVEQAREKLLKSQAQLADMQTKLDEYIGKERQIAEVMITAQINAQRIEAQARAKAEVLLQETEEELRRKNQELELLRIKVQVFKQEIGQRIDQFRVALDKIEPNNDPSFVPTLIPKDKQAQKLLG